MWRTQHPLGSGPVLTSLPVVSGYPVPRLYWFKDGQPLAASAHIRIVNKKTLHTLEVLSVTSEDAGQYSAYISNTVGAAYSSAQLQVQGVCWGLTLAYMSSHGRHGIGPMVFAPCAEVYWEGSHLPAWIPEGVGCRYGRVSTGPLPFEQTPRTMQDTRSYFRSDFPASFRP